MREKNRKPIEEMAEFPQFTTMHVIEGQAGQTIYASLNFYSLTIDNILNIIVMLILVTVTIRVATDGKLFTHAVNAAKGTKTAIADETAILNDDLGIADIVAAQTGEGGGAAGAAGEKFSSIYSADANYEDANGNVARIPKGFAVGTSNGINTVAGGLVITDHVAADGTSDGNEFVWIPVDSISNFVRTGWASNANTSTEATLYIWYTETEDSAYNAMKASVEQWKGFYIARFEAGTTAERRYDLTNATNLTPQSKKLLYPYNFINWTDAKTVSEGMYTGSSYGVTSTLCYGVQWDSVMRFISNTKNVSNSSSWGNYADNSFNYDGKYYNEVWEGNSLFNRTFVSAEWLTPETSTKTSETSTLLQTGACSDNQAKNIYDLAGNVSEWTMEALDSNRVYRGGNFNYNGDGSPASNRNNSDPSNSLNNFGFRPALYVSSLT